MSLNTSTCQQINGSPLNLSTSKQLYSFNKSPRFDKQENSSYCQQAFYELPIVLAQRATSLGYGKKSDLNGKIDLNSPGPTSYQLTNEFDNKNDQKKGFIFGVGREKMMQQSILGQLNKENPGPGMYNIPSGVSNIRYTLRVKPDASLLTKHKVVPGPGTYDTLPALTQKGIYTVSQFKNSGACIINPNSNRFASNYHTEAPGPGQYTSPNQGFQKVIFISYFQDGRQFNTQFKSSSCSSFPHNKRLTGSFGVIEKTPGPGTYKLHSDFGQYQQQLKSKHQHTME